MDITISIPSERIADLFTVAIESGDPVTTASKGGWCDGIFLKSHGGGSKYRGGGRTEFKGLWYTDPALYESDDLEIEIVEIDDETTGHKTRHLVSRTLIRKALKMMAEKHIGDLADLLTENDDATTADIFLQVMLFGEEKYA